LNCFPVSFSLSLVACQPLHLNLCTWAVWKNCIIRLQWMVGLVETWSQAADSLIRLL
jgi:hypothetical protein